MQQKLQAFPTYDAAPVRLLSTPLTTAKTATVAAELQERGWGYVNSYDLS